MQHDIHEKNTRLKLSTEQTNLLKQEAKNLELETIKLKSTLIKYEEELKLKSMPLSRAKGKVLKQAVNAS